MACHKLLTFTHILLPGATWPELNKAFQSWGAWSGTDQERGWWKIVKECTRWFLYYASKKPPTQTSNYHLDMNKKFIHIPKFSSPCKQIAPEDHWMTIIVFMQNCVADVLRALKTILYLLRLWIWDWEDYCGGQTDVWITAVCFVLFFKTDFIGPRSWLIHSFVKRFLLYLMS